MTEPGEAGAEDHFDGAGEFSERYRVSLTPLSFSMDQELRSLREENAKLRAQLNEQRRLARSAVLRRSLEHEERTRLEAAWLSSSALFGDWFESADLAMSWVASDGTILRANHAQLEMLGYEHNDYVGHALAEFLVDSEVLTAIVTAADSGKEARGMCASVYGKDRKLRSVRISCRNFRGGIGAGICCFMNPVEIERETPDKWINDRYVRQLAEHIREVLWLTSADGKTVLYVSPAYEEIWGRSCASLYQEPGSFVLGIHEDDRQRVKESLRTQASQRAYCEEYRVVRPDGSIRWIRDRAFPVRDSEGVIQRVAGLAEDITDLRRTDEKIRNHGARQKVLADLGHLALREPSIQKLFEEATVRLVETMGVDFAKVLEFSPEENRLWLRASSGCAPQLVGKHVVDVTDSEAGSALVSRTPVIVRDRRTDERFPASTALIKLGFYSGMSVVVEGRLHPFGVLGVHAREARSYSQDEADFLEAIAHILGAAIERKEAEKGQQDLSILLSQQKQTLDDILTNLPAIVWELRLDPETAELHLEYVSAYAETMLGYTREEFLARPTLWAERIHSSDQERIQVEMKRILAGERVDPLQFRWIARDGHLVWIDSTKRAFTDRHGNIVGVRGVALDATRRKAEEAGRRDAEERISDLLMTVPGVVWELRWDDEAQTFQPHFISDQIEKLLGYPKENWLSNSAFWLDCVHPEDRERMKDRFFGLASEDNSRVDQFRWLARDGRTVWVEAHRKARHDETGKVIGIRGVTVDITDRKAADVARKAAEERFGDILRTVPGVVWEMEVTADHNLGRLTFVSGYVETISGGYRAEELLRTPALWQEIVHPDDREKMRRSLMKLLQGETGEAVLTRWTRRDGRLAWVEATQHLVLDDRGKPMAVRGVTMDVTDRKLAELARESVEERFYAFMDNSPMMGLMKDEEGHLIYANQAFRDWCKDIHVDWYGSTDYDYLPEEVAHRTRRNDREALDRNTTTQTIETSYVKEGALRFWNVLRFPIMDAGGKRFLGTVAIDITARRRLEKELLEISDRAQRRLGQELHDGVCQHLLGIAMMARTLAERMAKKGLPEANDARSIAEFLDEALTVTRGLMQGLHLGNVEGPAGLIAALEEFSRTTTKLFGKPCEFRSLVTINVKDRTLGSHLFRIAQEATHNAVKHGDPTRVVLTLRREEAALVLTVENDGKRLPPDFTQSPGFGMRTMKYRAGLIGADLHFENRPEGGVCVSCRVPAGPGLGIEFVDTE